MRSLAANCKPLHSNSLLQSSLFIDSIASPLIVRIRPPQCYNFASARSGGGCKTRVGDRVRFSLASVFLPDAQEVLAALSLASEVEGTIVDFSDSGQAERAFAVVDVVQRRTIIVPVDKLRLETDEDESGKDLV
jgi:hypothetical protein